MESKSETIKELLGALSKAQGEMGRLTQDEFMQMLQREIREKVK